MDLALSSRAGPSPTYAGRMPVRRPHPSLRPYVRSMVGYHDVMDDRLVHHGLPSPELTVVLAFDQPLDVGWLSEPGSDRYWACVAGMHTAPALIRTHGYQHGIQLGLTPLGARAVLGVPAAALAGAMAEHSDLPAGVGTGLLAALADHSGWQDRFDVLEQWLRRRVARHRDDPSYAVTPEVAEAWRVVLARRGQMRVDDLARLVGRSRRRLLADFRAEYGLSPKDACRIVRFDHARRLVAGGTPLVDAAAVAGYADQAHLAREWRALAGRTPTQLRECPYHVG